MHTLRTILVSAAAFAGCVSAHGGLADPQGRIIGTHYKDVCGEQLYNLQKGDALGNVQQMEQQLQGNSKGFDPAQCNIYLCKGYQFADQPESNIQHWKPNQVVPIQFKVGAPHTGFANISLVHTATNKMIGDPLMTWTSFASTKTGVKKNQTDFEVTIPDVKSQCPNAGDCVLQHFWDSKEANQTYYTCLDFVMDS